MSRMHKQKCLWRTLQFRYTFVSDSYLNGKGYTLGPICFLCSLAWSYFVVVNVLNEVALSNHDLIECNCLNGVCNSGPDGNGECYCQPPFSGPRCDTGKMPCVWNEISCIRTMSVRVIICCFLFRIVSETCRNCSAYYYCKGEGANAVCECLPDFKKIGRICAGMFIFVHSGDAIKVT